MTPRQAMREALHQIAHNCQETVCISVEDDGDLVTGINEAASVLTVAQHDRLSDLTEFVRLGKGPHAELVLTALLALLDPNQERWQRVPVGMDLGVQCALSEIRTASQRLVEAVGHLEREASGA